MLEFEPKGSLHGGKLSLGLTLKLKLNVMGMAQIWSPREQQSLLQ